MPTMKQPAHARRRRTRPFPGREAPWPCTECGARLGVVDRRGTLRLEGLRVEIQDGPCVLVTCATCRLPRRWWVDITAAALAAAGLADAVPATPEAGD